MERLTLFKNKYGNVFSTEKERDLDQKIMEHVKKFFYYGMDRNDCCEMIKTWKK